MIQSQNGLAPNPKRGHLLKKKLVWTKKSKMFPFFPVITDSNLT